MEPEEHARMPSLVVPFALVGAAAAVFSISGIAALRQGAHQASLADGAVAGAAGGAALGLILRHWRSLHARMIPRGITAFRVALATIVAGALIGGGVGWLAWGAIGVVPFALGGSAASLAFIPACLTVLDAGRRAARARMGSVVAASDRRTIWGTVLSVIAATSLVGVPTIAGGCGTGSLSAPQQVSLVLCVAVACVLGGLWLAWRDAAGSEQLRRSVGSQPLKETVAAATAAADCLDVGIGENQWGRVASAATYRAAEREEVTLLGDLDTALFALDDARRRRARTQVLAAFSIIASLATAWVSDVREVGAPGCFRRVHVDAGCACVEKDHFPPRWPD